MEPLSANDPRAVGDFALRARLGAGGMGQVYLGSSPAGRAVAVKVVHQQLASDPEFRRRFGREVAAARAVSGMYTAPVVATGLDDDPPWFATAYVPGPSLADVVNARGALPEAALWRLAAGLAEALRAVHGSGLVHRDLKPANVLLAADGPHVIDFGISRALEGTALTSTGMVVGTPGYMSPEQAEGVPAGPASDVFSLGCVLAYAATGKAPFGTGSAASVLYKVVTGEPDLAGIPAKLRQVIEACMKKNPAERTELTQLGTAIAAFSPASPVAFGSFWPEPLNSIIAASQAYPTPTEVGSAAAGQSRAAHSQAAHSQAAPSQAAPSQAAPSQAAGQAGLASPPGPASGPVSPLPSGLKPTLTAQGGAPVTSGRRLMRIEVPPAVNAAVGLMWTGFAATVLDLIFSLAVLGRYSHDATHDFYRINREHANAMAGHISLAILADALGLIAWIWLAMATRHGRGWTSAVGSVLAGVYSVSALTILLATHNDPAVKVFTLIVWVIALAAVFLLWSQQAREFFTAWRR